MFNRLARLSLLIIAPLMLFGCVLTPGKFVSTMSINADRTFNFTYKGEVIAADLGKGFGKGLTGSDKKDSDGDDEPTDDAKPLLLAEDRSEVGMADIAVKENSETLLKNQAIAAALSKEYGYRSVHYVGKGKFEVDYSISGTLTHNFTFPINLDAEAMFPFVIVELRQGKLIRVKAPGFASETSKSGNTMGGTMGKETPFADGIFTLDTDAEIVSQNNENGAAKLGARKSISWKVNPLTKDAPTAVLRLAR
jgi:hypothetical protein